MPYKLIAIDLDGTLLRPDGTVSARTRSALLAAVGSGLRICYATGRNWNESVPVFETVGHLEYAVTVGGAVVMDGAARRALLTRRMDPRLAADVSAVLEDGGHEVLALQDHEESDVQYLLSGTPPEKTSVDEWFRLDSRRHETLRNLSHEHTLRLSIVAEADEILEAISRLSEVFAKRIVFHCITLHVRSEALGRGVQLLEVFDPEVNKWSALQFVAQRMGVAEGEIIAVGDDVNDLPMLRSAGLGIAMGNAHPEAKAAAKKIIGTNAEDGLAVFLEELVKTQSESAAVN